MGGRPTKIPLHSLIMQSSFLDVEAQKRPDASIIYPPTDSIPASSPRLGESSSYFPTQFRTLSIHVESEIGGGKENAKRSRAVRG